MGFSHPSLILGPIISKALTVHLFTHLFLNTLKSSWVVLPTDNLLQLIKIIFLQLIWFYDWLMCLICGGCGRKEGSPFAISWNKLQEEEYTDCYWQLHAASLMWKPGDVPAHRRGWRCLIVRALRSGGNKMGPHLFQDYFLGFFLQINPS